MARDVPDFSPARPVRASAQIVEQVEQAIAAGSVRPGDRLPSERELMTQFDVSRSTVREALRVLESAGLVRSRHGDPRGPEVLEASPATLYTSLTRLARLDGVTLPELLQFRILLEGAACSLAALRRKDDDVARLSEAVEAMAQALTAGWQEFSRADVAFHAAIWQASGNRLIEITGNVVRDVVTDLVSNHLEHAPDADLAMHESLARDREILAAIRDGDGPLAGALARRYVYEAYHGYTPEDEAALRLVTSPSAPADSPVDAPAT